MRYYPQQQTRLTVPYPLCEHGTYDDGVWGSGDIAVYGVMQSHTYGIFDLIHSVALKKYFAF